MGEIRPLSPAQQRRRRQGPFFTFFSEGGQTQSQKGEWGMGALGLVR